jgi:hypothetical protein
MSKVINIYKSQSIVEPKVKGAIINLNEELPDNSDIVEETFIAEGKQLEEVLSDTLPGGTYDQLFICMMQRKASQLVISNKDSEI